MQERQMNTASNELGLELELATNRCRMELVSLQAQYYMLIIQNVYIGYLKKYESIEIYTKDELLEMLSSLENIINDLETESMIDGKQKYEIRDSLPFIEECMSKMMQRYGFKNWIID